MTLTGTVRTTRINTSQTVAAPASAGCVQPNGAGKWATIENLPKKFTIKAYYTHTGSSGGTGKLEVMERVGSTDTSLIIGDVTDGGTVKTLEYEFDNPARSSVTLVLNANTAAIRIFDVIITPQ